MSEPQEYATVFNEDACTTRADALVNVANVFVTTTPPLPIPENPVTAHDDYFESGSVRQATRCGGTGGKIAECVR